MYRFTTDDGRILTPPAELETLLRGSFPAFSKLLGHTRFYYMMDEAWDGVSSLAFNADSEQFITVTLEDSVFYVHIANECFKIVDETLLENAFGLMKNTVPISYHRPFEHLSIHPDPIVFPCGYRCDLCLGSKEYNDHDLSESDNFVYMNWVCYHGCVPGADIERPSTNEKGKGIFRCSGCTKNRNKFCQSYTCSKAKGYANCVECGEYHLCDVYRDSHYAGQCNLGITAEEVTKLVIPYCMKERLDCFRAQLKENR
jgi:hypothetical protein